MDSANHHEKLRGIPATAAGDRLRPYEVIVKREQWLHSLQLTAIAPENRLSQKERIVLQPSICRCENDSFREGIISP